MSESKIEYLHFIVEGRFLQNHARQGFWFEDREDFAIQLLKEGLVGITDDQVMNIINGDAVLRGASICDRKDCRQCKGLEQITYTEQVDKEFKDEVRKRQLWLNDNYYKIGEHHVKKYKINEFIKLYKKLINYEQNDPFFVPVAENEVRDLEHSFYTSESHRPPSPDYMPEKGSYEYKYIETINGFLKHLKTEISNNFPHFDKLKFLKQYEVVKETSSKLNLKQQRAEGCILLLIPNPKNDYKLTPINLAKEHLLNYLNVRARGEHSMKFTLSMDLEKEAVLKRYKNLAKNMANAHEALMESMGLDHNSSGIYQRDSFEFFVNEAVQFFVLDNILDLEIYKKEIDKLPNEIKLILPENHGYMDVYVDGKLVEEKRDFH